MNFRALLSITSIVAGLAGLGLLLAPTGMQQPFGIAAERASASSSVAQLLGAYMISFGIVFWAIRGIASIEATTTLAKAISATFVIGTGVAAMLQLKGAMGPLGWGIVGIYAVFAGLYAYFGFGRGVAAGS